MHNKEAPPLAVPPLSWTVTVKSDGCAVEKAKEVMREESMPLSGAWRQVVPPVEADGAGE